MFMKLDGESIVTLSTTPFLFAHCFSKEVCFLSVEVIPSLFRILLLELFISPGRQVPQPSFVLPRGLWECMFCRCC